MSLDRDLRALRKAKQDRDTAKQKFEDADSAFRQLQFKVMERMKQKGVESMKLDGTLFVPTETVYAQIQDRAEFVAWAEEHDDELVEPKERKEILNSMVRQRLDDGEALPPGVTFYVREYISQRAA